jgi:hypothetical protein
MTTATQPREPEMGLTFEKVWAMFQETDRRMRELREETDRRMRESSEETDRKIQEVSQQIGRLGNRFGELAEHLVAPNLLEKFKALGFTFTKYFPNAEIRGEDGQLLAEIDIFLENGDCSMAVEVKAQLKSAGVDEHVKRMEVIRRDADAHGDTRKLYGAVAGAIVHPRVRDYAVEMGFYVAAQSGDTMNIDVPEGFVPKAW